MGTIMTFLFGAVLGSVVAWLWAVSQVRAAMTGEMVNLRATIGGRDSTITELRLQIAEQNTVLTQLRSDLDAAREARAVADTRLEEYVRSFEQQAELLATAEQRLKDTFTALSADALKNNSALFVSQVSLPSRSRSDLVTVEVRVLGVRKDCIRVADLTPAGPSNWHDG